MRTCGRSPLLVYECTRAADSPASAGMPTSTSHISMPKLWYQASGGAGGTQHQSEHTGLSGMQKSG